MTMMNDSNVWNGYIYTRKNLQLPTGGLLAILHKAAVDAPQKQNCRAGHHTRHGSVFIDLLRTNSKQTILCAIPVNAILVHWPAKFRVTAQLNGRTLCIPTPQFPRNPPPTVFLRSFHLGRIMISHGTNAIAPHLAAAL